MASNQKNLVQHDSNIDEAERMDSGSHVTKIAVKGQEDKRKGNKEKFPDPKSIAAGFNDRPYDGIHLPSAIIQNKYCKE